MIDAVLTVPVERVTGNHDIRLEATNPAHDFAPQIQRMLQLAIPEAQEDHLLHAQRRRRAPLFFLANLYQTFMRHVRL